MWFLLACAAASGPEAATDAGQADDAGEVGDTATTVPRGEPSLTAADVAEALQPLVDETFPDTRQLRDVYLAMMRAGEAGCPGEDDQLEDGSIPLAGCTSQSGYTYVGLSEYAEDDSGYALDLGDFYITDPEGRTFAVGGTFDWAAGDSGSWTAQALGSFSYPGAEGWLGEGASLALWLDGGPGALAIDGGLGTLDAGGQLYFDALTWGACGTDPTGAIRLRGPEGDWYRLDLDCSSCGTVVWAGSPLGEACVDLGALADSLTTRLSP